MLLMERTNHKVNGLENNTECFSRDKGRYNNCYTYAVNQYLNPFTKKPYSDYDQCQPSNLGGEKYTLTGNSHCYTDWLKFDIIDCVKSDLNKINLNIRESNFDEFTQSDECWKVALCMHMYSDGENGDYHWYRQNIDGTWSHKTGMGSIKFEDFDGNIIYNPQECDRGKYNKFVGFFMIEPLH